MSIPPASHSSESTPGPRSLFLPLAVGRRKARAASTALVGVLALSQAVSPLLAAPTTTEERPTNPKNEGFTRESMAELSRPEAPPAPKGPLVSPRVARSQVDGKDYVPHRVSSSSRIAQTETDGKDYNPSTRVARRTRTHARPDEERVAARARSHRRNPAESFVFWWNGWVIRTFHSRVGTVMLGSIGAKS